uniref:Family with sequence similarity 78 member A n=1 Tax=Piliocolobus tephrosceles TaxID=591936 RepID=A0A8C9J1K2_9PRIM
MPGFLCDCWPSLEIRALLCAMGCIQSIGGKARVFREGITVIDVKASIDPVPTSIDESSSVVLRYRTPHFRASAQVVMPPIPKKETWIVGWIQACSHMEFYNQYGEQGMSSWELPDLQEGKIQAISDSDGVNYPWYGNTTETCTIVGPTKRDSKFIISMNDNFYPSVTWAVPVSESNVAKLTNIYRDQSFTTWLVATNTSTNDMIILQTLHWRMQLSIEVNPNRPLGQRARLREPIAQDQPKILSKNEPIPPSALVKPNANDAQRREVREKSITLEITVSRIKSAPDPKHQLWNPEGIKRNKKQKTCTPNVYHTETYMWQTETEHTVSRQTLKVCEATVAGQLKRTIS